MLRFILSRLASTVPVLLVVSITVFLVLRLAPGDPAAVIGGSNATTEDIAAIRQTLGLDKSLLQQFFIFISNLLHGDLGRSYYFNKPVATLIADRVGPTLSIASGTMLFAVAVAVPMGTLAAWRMGGWLDRLVMGFSVLGFSVPVFVVAYLLIMPLSLKLGLLPVQGYVPPSDGLQAWASHLVLPWIALGTVYVALLARVTRASVSEALTEDYIRTARAKGVSQAAVLFRHALVNAAVPIVTVVGIGVSLLIGGVVVTETVFAIPGLGSMTVEAVLNRDFPVIQGVVLFFAFANVAINLLVDLCYLALDPRIRY